MLLNPVMQEENAVEIIKYPLCTLNNFQLYRISVVCQRAFKVVGDYINTVEMLSNGNPNLLLGTEVWCFVESVLTNLGGALIVEEVCAQDSCPSAELWLTAVGG